jgi:hypothetical protein
MDKLQTESMVKRLISVPKRTDERLKHLRRYEGISQWFFIRKALEDALNRHDAKKHHA